MSPSCPAHNAGGPRRAPGMRGCGGVLLCCVAAFLLNGCASSSLDSVRSALYSGRLEDAKTQLDQLPEGGKDQVLLMMERGLILQQLGYYEESSADFLQAKRILGDLETYSVSKGGSSLVVNDNVQSFRGAPYERALLHAFTAKSYMALGEWNDAAVEARRMIFELSPQVRGNYPDNAYCRYMAGFCLALVGDRTNAEMQYRLASALTDTCAIDPRSGVLEIESPRTTEVTTDSHELVCFVGFGNNGPVYAHATEQAAGYAELYYKGTYLGRSCLLADTAQLEAETEKVDSTRKSAKTATRVVIKEGAAEMIGQSTDEVWGELARVLLIGLLERPDVRHWQSLPRRLHVARVPCPPGLDEYDVVFKNANGYTTDTLHVEQPLQKHRTTYVSFCRDPR